MINIFKYEFYFNLNPPGVPPFLPAIASSVMDEVEGVHRQIGHRHQHRGNVEYVDAMWVIITD